VGELIADFGHVVSISTEPDNALFIQVKLHRPHLRYQYIYSHVPFNASNQQWLAYILLNNTLLLQLKLHHIIDERNATPPRQVCRFEDPSLLLGVLSIEAFNKFVVFVRQHERQGNKVVDFAED